MEKYGGGIQLEEIFANAAGDSRSYHSPNRKETVRLAT